MPPPSTQLKLAVSATRAQWAAVLCRRAVGWSLLAGERVGAARAAQLLDAASHHERWLLGALASGRMRSRAVSAFLEAGSGKLYVFPNSTGGLILLVGSRAEMDQTASALFQLVSLTTASGDLTPPEGQGPRGGAEEDSGEFDFSGDRQALLQESYRIAGQIGGFEIAELDLQTVMDRAIKRARELVNGDWAELGMVDHKEQVVRILACERVGRVQQVIPLGEEAAGKIAQGQAGQVLDGAVGVPLRFRGQVIGVLVVLRADPARKFSEGDLKLLELLAPQISISIRNARLFQELGERIKAQKAAEAKVVEAARLTAIGEMAASVAHELNNPLTTITGFTELLLDDLPADFRQRADLELVLREARRAREVVRRLLDFSRRGDNIQGEIRINDAVSEVLALVHSIGQTQGIDVQFEAWDALPVVTGDQNQIKQVLLNLVYNGFQAMPQGGTMVIQTASEQRADGTWAVIRVQDVGAGIPEVHQPQIFEPFFTTKPLGSGTGLGLSISKSIIVEHGGAILLESTGSSGSVFVVRLPVPGKA